MSIVSIYLAVTARGCEQEGSRGAVYGAPLLGGIGQGSREQVPLWRGPGRGPVAPQGCQSVHGVPRARLAQGWQERKS